MIDRIVLIAGPTASGKSALALKLAEELGGAVVNADSMQVYRELRVLTARPSAEDEARAPHFLYGHVAGHEGYSAGRFATEASAAIRETWTRGLLPIVVGGTGLYFRALTEGLSPIPAIDPAIRTHWRAEAVRLGPPALHAELERRDPAMAGRLSPSDPQRVTRALEVLDSTGRSLADWQATPGRPAIDAARATKLVLLPERAELHRRADARFDAMMATGALGEVEGLMAEGLDPGLPVMRALGVRPLMQLVRGEVRRAAAVEQGKAETRQYIKRQETWLNSNMIAWNAIVVNEMKYCLRDALAFIRS